jgi:hypothetical protein
MTFNVKGYSVNKTFSIKKANSAYAFILRAPLPPFPI